MKKVNVVIVGATGLVGLTFLKIIEEYHIEVNNLKLVASKKSKGKKIKFKNQYYEVEELTSSSFDNADFILFSAGKNISDKYAPIAEKHGIVIDNSSCFRMENDIVLIVPEINFNDFISSKRKIIANPNCSTIQCVIPLYCIAKKYHLKKVIYSTYQSVSGSGMKGIFDYQSALDGYPCEFYPYDISKTCIPLIGEINDNDYTDEEIKMVNETRKILHLPSLEVFATCVRVPVSYGHGVSVYVEVEEDIDIEIIKKLLKTEPSIVIKDIPTSIDSLNNDKVYVGRIRKCLANSLMFYCNANNIRRGASSNAIEIMKRIIMNND